ncbi:SAVED domain-containing protein [Noviherbaspirillum pedocola]|uniref:HNH endonuclease n=1 Tax=Noviherbaspirillum pedocola TaxID=2801341 RepID=A0A934ST31_9BURK|nr:SAVED domain-containing protein [Noviherbaspirillum pedocola]MBK4734691.1 HNH endonuclease [Noviherbaspirillum pedocola]
MTSHLTDEGLSQKLTALGAAKAGRRLLVVADAFHSQLFTDDPATGAWIEIGLGDIADKSIPLLKPFIRAKKVEWVTVPKLDPRIAPAEHGPSALQTSSDFDAWVKHRDKITMPTGRQADITPKVAREVERLAAWRCQLDGCGDDLSAHYVDGATGNYAYLAHIVAASPDGPRGDKVWSSLLANDVSNIMLLCDKCHRLIDRINPDAYPREVLEEMRERHVSEVKRLLDTLAYPSAQILVVGGNIAGQNVRFDRKAAEEAMWERKLRAASTPHTFSQNAGFLWDTATPNYWETLFESLKTEIPALRGLLNGSSRGGAAPASLAVFPLHNTSVQILSGRLLGESGTAHVFQFHRNEVAGKKGGQWRWPDVPTPAPDKFKVNELRAFREGDAEATLLVYLTCQIPSTELPGHLFDGEDFVLPTLEVTVDAPSHAAISHPMDLELAGKAFDIALQKIQDIWRLQRIHLVAIAPSSTCVRLGQKFQARNHRPVMLYERSPVNAPATFGPFVQTIEIGATEVRRPGTGSVLNLA